MHICTCLKRVDSVGEYVVEVLVAVIVSNMIQAWLTVQGVKVHIEYLKTGVDRAHRRIDHITGVGPDG